MNICTKCHAFKFGPCVCELREIPWWRKDKLGWPIELVIGKPFGNIARIVLQNIRKIGGL